LKSARILSSTTDRHQVASLSMHTGRTHRRITLRKIQTIMVSSGTVSHEITQTIIDLDNATDLSQVYKQGTSSDSLTYAVTIGKIQLEDVDNK
jgi:hypothetical protein